MFGLSAEWLLHEGRVVPSTIVLSHDEQRARLRRYCPEAVPHTLVAGDICFDRLRASRPLRATYRNAMGVGPHQKLIVISSTWGPDSLLAEDPDLPRRLACALPVDEFRIVLALHPNIRAHHSRWQLAEYLSGAERAGVHVCAGVDDWRSNIVAADLVVGDHGSVSFYSTALGNPLLLATAPHHTVDPDSPIARLLAVAPQLDTEGDLLVQVRRVLTEHRAHRYRDIVALTTSHPDASAGVLRAAMYHALRLPEPGEPADLQVLPSLDQPLRAADSHMVGVSFESDRHARITRYPAERLQTTMRSGPGTHLAVGLREPRRRWLDLADAVIATRGVNDESWIADTLAALPGCQVAATPIAENRWAVGDRERIFHVTGSNLSCRLFASVYTAHASNTAALPTGAWEISCGPSTHAASVTPAM